MIDPERVLQPLAAAGAALDRLDNYRTPEELASAIDETQRAVDRALRLLLRSDTRAPDDLRLAALAPETSLDAVVIGLRQRDLITLELAGTVHELSQAAERARSGTVRARDADIARRTVERLRYETSSAADAPVRAVAHEAAAVMQEAAHEVPRSEGGRMGRGWVVGLVVVALAAIVGAWLLTRSDPVQEGISAFEAGRLGIAERHFATLIEDDSANVTAMLYLGRIRRTQGRYEEAGAVLQAAAVRAPDDADVQRELGYLFLDLGAPVSAITRFRVAQELEPESVAGWVGLVRALRAAGDPSAEEVLARAPAEARALLTRP